MYNQIDEAVFVQYLCYIRSASGMWAAYDGYVEVHAPDNATDDEIFRKAVQTLARTSFPDRPSLSSWVLDRVERA
ncbi:conserved hypothetical protein [Candidatus Methylobacter favarea]|jgi:hypothetical protein|uniref:Uncharacterized protein n=1 Tax=Candidatus Methylobacter favarea TaxID=2707345 RepID=A0A8S0WAI9_9GAMM|nr:hypothetical protein [Candidatus Methylobacter favarea]CAA9890779.1 conserved hypothetical protein [Candidatus Methylobacter favarea]